MANKEIIPTYATFSKLEKKYFELNLQANNLESPPALPVGSEAEFEIGKSELIPIVGLLTVGFIYLFIPTNLESMLQAFLFSSLAAVTVIPVSLLLQSANMLRIRKKNKKLWAKNQEINELASQTFQEERRILREKQSKTRQKMNELLKIASRDLLTNEYISEQYVYDFDSKKIAKVTMLAQPVEQSREDFSKSLSKVSLKELEA